MIRPRFTTIAMFVAVATVAAAQTRTSLADLSFEAPTGWSVTQDNGSVKLTPRGIQAGGHCFVMLTPPEMLSGDFPSWYNNKWQSVLRIAKVVQSSQPVHQVSSGSDNDAISASAVLQDPQQRTFWVILFGIRVGQRAFPLLWMANSQELLAKYQPAVQQLMGSLKLQPTTTNNGSTGS